MAKKIIAISGAHRDSNTDAVLKKVIDGCKEAGAEVTLVVLRTLNFGQCCGWSDCYYENRCIVKDTLTPLFDQLDTADGIILASPTYFDNVSGIMKNFMDRTNPYCKPPRYEGKKAALVCIGGASEKSIAKCTAALEAFCFHHRLDVFGSYAAVADHEREVLAKNNVLTDAKEFGRKFAQAI